MRMKWIVAAGMLLTILYLIRYIYRGMRQDELSARESMAEYVKQRKKLYGLNRGGE